MSKIEMLVLIVVILLLVGFGVWWEYGMWKECMRDHGFFYCLRILS